MLMVMMVMVVVMVMVFSVCIRHLYLTGFLLLCLFRRLCLFRLLRFAYGRFQLFFILIHITLPKNAM